MAESNKPKYSVVVPVYNEVNNLEELDRRLEKTLDALGPYEIIYVDDGSDDGSSDILDSLCKHDSRKLVRMPVNLGQSAAIGAGIKAARSPIVITIDADLQNPPEEITKLVKELERGDWDCVSGWRKNRKDPLLQKKLPSYISNWLGRNLLNTDIHDFGCTLKAYKRSALSGLEFWDGAHRYIPGMLALRKKRITELPVAHNEREKGESKYSLLRLVFGFIDLFYIRFIYKPSLRPRTLAITSLAGSFLAGLAFVAASFLTRDEYLRTNLAVASAPFFMLGMVLSLLWWLLSIRYREITREVKL